MKWMIVSFLLLPLGILGCENKSSTLTQTYVQPQPFEPIDTLESLRASLKKQSTLSPQTLQFIQKTEISQRKPILLFCKDTSSGMRERTQQVLSIVAKKDVLFQKQLILWLDAEESVASASELILESIGAELFPQAAQISNQLSPLSRVRLLHIFKNISNSSIFVENIKKSLASTNSSEQDFAIDCTLNLSDISPESILILYLHQENLTERIALKLSLLGNAEGAEQLLFSLLKEDPHWSRVVGKAFFQLGKKGIPAMKAVLHSSNERLIPHILELQLILKHKELLLDILPLLSVAHLKEQAHACLCLVTQKDVQWDQEEWRKIILKE